MSKNKALSATAMTKDLPRLVEQHGHLPVPVGAGHTQKTPDRPKVMRAVRGKCVKTRFACHRQLLSDFDAVPVICLG